MRKPSNIKGMAFLEVIVVSTLVAAIMMAVTYAIYTLANASLISETAVRGGYAQASALYSSLDRDFASADKVFFIPGRQTKLGGSIPWDGTGATNNFELYGTVPVDNVTYTNSFLTSTNNVSGGAGRTMPFTLSPLTNYYEVHFLSGSSIKSVLAVLYTTNSVSYNRYTVKGGLVNQLYFYDTEPNNIPVFLTKNYANLTQNLVSTNTTNGLTTMSIRIPNIRKLHNYSVGVTSSTNAYWGTDTNSIKNTMPLPGTGDLLDSNYNEPLEIQRILP